MGKDDDVKSMQRSFEASMDEAATEEPEASKVGFTCDMARRLHWFRMKQQRISPRPATWA